MRSSAHGVVGVGLHAEDRCMLTIRFVRHSARLARWAALSAAAVACSQQATDDVELGSLGQALDTPLEVKGFFTFNFASSTTNRCAEDVPAAFQRLPQAPTGKVRYRSQGGQRLPPFDARLADFGDWDSHVQSIARLSVPWGDNLWAAVSRANPGSTGGAGVFLVDLGDVHGADGTRWVLPG